MSLPSPYSTPSSRWTAITTRDPLSTSSFIYAVHTTKVYCRPTCPARIARRANVTFYNTAQEAVTAGYRACLRCRPDDAAGQVDSVGDVVEKVRGYVREWVVGGRGGELRIEGVARGVGVGARYLQKVFKERIGITMGAYLDAVRKGELTFDDEAARSIDTRSATITPDYSTGSSPLDSQLASSWPWSTVPGESSHVAHAYESLDPSLLEDWIDWDQCNSPAGRHCEEESVNANYV